MKKKTLLFITFGIILLLGGVLAMKSETISIKNLFGNNPEGISSFAGEELTKEDYYTIFNIKTTGSYEFILKNPDNKSLNFSEIKEKTKEGGKSPLDFEIVIKGGGISSDKFYEIRNVSVPTYNLTQNGSYIVSYDEVIDLNATHLSLYVEGKNYLINKLDILNYSTKENTVDKAIYIRIQNGTKIVEKKVEISSSFVEKISLNSGEERKIIREIKPKISPLPEGGWGYSIYTNPWFNTTFEKRINITFDNSASSENFTDFPVLVILNSTRINYSLTLDDGSDIRFIDDDGSTILSHEIEIWNETGNSFVWVKVPLLENTTSDFIQMYYNNQSNVNDGQNVADVWSNNYQAVYHMNDDDISTFVNDSLGNHDGLVNGAPVRVAGKIGGGIDFDGGLVEGVDYIDLGTWDLVGSGLTLSSWFTTEINNACGGRILSKSSGGAGEDHYWMMNVCNDDLRTRIKAGGSTITVVDSNADDIAVDTFYLSTATYDGSDATIYRNDAISATSAKTGTIGTNAGVGISIARNGDDTDDDNYLGGIVDEVRIRNITSSGDWIEAHHLSSLDNFNTFSAEETAPVVSAAPQWFDNSSNSTIAGTFVKHNVRWTDETALSGYIFSFDNGTGTLTNDSFIVMVGTNNWSNVTKPVNATVGSTIRWQVYANDSSNNLNATDIFQYTTTSATTCTCPGLNNNWEINLSQSCLIYTDCDIGTGNISWIETGFAEFNATIECLNMDALPNNGLLKIGSQNLLKIGT